ncbi:hypothetical protein [Streptomyces silaceus]|uniref:hypothetical protein n=1 Tax=Streptomyces silaceus TaxID=545123 RepID=UPI000A9D6B1E|nr:hypothetical protein [Streptomyces silaceus]
MSKLLSRVKRFARSSEGRRAVREARRASSDPRRRAEAKGFIGRLRGGKSGKK